jgi:hypothetical protein
MTQGNSGPRPPSGPPIPGPALAPGRRGSPGKPPKPPLFFGRVDDALKAVQCEKLGGQRFSLELTTPLEQAFWTSLYFIAYLFILGLAAMYKPLIIGAAAAFFGVVLLINITDNHYEIDLVQKKFFYHFQVGFYETLTELAPFSRIAGVTVQGLRRTRRRGKNYASNPFRVWWEYATVLILDNGQVIEVSDYESEELLTADLKAKAVAAATGAPYIETPKQTYLRVQMSPDRQKVFSITHFHYEETVLPLWELVFTLILLAVLVFFQIGVPR